MQVNFHRNLFTTLFSALYMKVAIVGSGASSLVAAKSLLQVGIKPTIFEKTSSLGGIWKPTNLNGKCWNSLRTNLSKFTCVFSDFPWPKHCENIMFPSSLDMYQYLWKYSEHFGITEHISYNSTVVNTSLTSQGKYSLEWINALTNTLNVEIFDAVVVASGFFEEPNNHIGSLLDGDEALTINLIPSSSYINSEPYRNKSVVIIGSSFSSTEIASEVSFVAKKVFNIQPRPIYTLPRYLPINPLDPASPFLPIDLLFYQFKQIDLDSEVWESENKPVLSSVRCEIVTKTHESRKLSKQYLNNVIFGVESSESSNSHSELIPGELLQLTDDESYAHISISDTYLQQRMNGKIAVLYGRYIGINQNNVLYKNNNFHVNPAASDSTTDGVSSIGEIDAIIDCRGYKPNLSFLHSSILEHLEHVDNDTLLPILLYKSFCHPTLKNLFFVGCYKGPYFGIMELQAKYLSGVLSGSLQLPSDDSMFSYIDKLKEIRQSTHKPQSIHSDYVGFATNLAAEIKILSKPSLRRKYKVMVPALFSLPQGKDFSESLFNDTLTQGAIEFSKVEATQDEHMADVTRTMNKFLNEGYLISLQIYHSLLSTSWSFHRQLNSKLDSSPSGQVDGTVTFTLLQPQPKQQYENSNGRDDRIRSSIVQISENSRTIDTTEYPDLLYEEYGVFATLNGHKFDISRRYIYTYNSAKDSLDIYFAKSTSSNSYERDYLFVSLQFRPTSLGWVGSSCHPCGQDIYNSSFTFAFRGVFCRSIQMKHDVLGPTKDYVSTTTLFRN